ncbi:MAG: hypothetical protein AAF639_18125 [Chloroflexota bacterium]
MSNIVPHHEFFPYDGSTFNEVKAVTFSGPYDELPRHRGVGLFSMLQFINDSRRNMSDRRDIRPYFDKLIHANGIAFTGVWRIDQETPYTGYFATGSEGLLIARASVAGPGTRRRNRRALGIAGKVYPTLDPEEKVMPGNFVTVSHLSGFKTDHATTIEMFNWPIVGISLAATLVNRIIFRMMDTRPGFRQLFPISTLGMSPDDPISTPVLMRLKLAEGMPKVDADDFRDEMRLEHYPDRKLIYDIHVNDDHDNNRIDQKAWRRIGQLEFTDYAISEGSDKRIHFWIPSDKPL